MLSGICLHLTNLCKVQVFKSNVTQYTELKTERKNIHIHNQFDFKHSI